MNQLNLRQISNELVWNGLLTELPNELAQLAQLVAKGLQAQEINNK